MIANTANTHALPEPQRITVRLTQQLSITPSLTNTTATAITQAQLQCEQINAIDEYT